MNASEINMDARDTMDLPAAKRQKTTDTRFKLAQDKPSEGLLVPIEPKIPCAEKSKCAAFDSSATKHGCDSSIPPGDPSGDETTVTANNLGKLLRRALPRRLSQGSGTVLNRMHLNYFKVLLRTPGSIGLAKFGLGLPGDLVGRLDESNLGHVFARASTENTRYTLQMKLHNEPCLSRIDPSSKQILDLGAGGGIWASDVAAKCERLGTKVHAGDTYDRMVTFEPPYLPPNLEFHNMDIIHGPPTGGTMDVIRISHAIAHVTDQKHLLDACYSALSNGGSLEIQAFEPIVRKRHEPENFDHPLNIFIRLLCRDALSNLSRVDPLEDFIDGLSAAGFPEVKVMTQTVPIGLQQDVGSMKSRMAGALFRHVLHDYISYVDRSRFILRGLSDEQINMLIQLTRDAIQERNGQHYMRLVFLSAKKRSPGWDDAATDMGSDSSSDMPKDPRQPDR